MIDRKTPPPFVHTTSFDLIHPDRKYLSNGVELFLIPGGNQDVIKIELIFKAGRWYEVHTGASHFCATLLTKGTDGKGSFQIAQIFDQYGAHVDISPGLDFVSVSLYVVTKYLRPVLDLLIEVVTMPAFPVREIEQAEAIFLQNLKVNEEKTSFLASKTFRRKLFGQDHPYGKEIEEADVRALGRKQLLTHYQTRYKQLTVFVSGKIDNDSEDLIAQSFSAIDTAESETVKNSPSGTQSFHQYIAKEGSVQTSIRAGKKSLLRSDSDYARAVFFSHILGGYFGSRLMKNIREEKGLTYGVYASLHPLQHDSYLVIGADVNKENVNLTLDEIKKEMKILRTEPIGTEELHTTKNHFIGSLQAEITTPFAHADKIKTIELHGLSPDYYQHMIELVDAMTADDILEVGNKYFHEDTLNEVAVG